MLAEVDHPTYANFGQKVITAGVTAGWRGRLVTGPISLRP